MTTDFLQADSPITLPQEDALGRAPFAEKLARSIMKIRGDDSLVFGISGEWGTGKSSVLNMIEHFIKNSEEFTPTPIIIHFNPWWFSGRDQLLPMFFSQLSAAIGQSDDAARMKGLGKSIRTYAKALRLIGYWPGAGAFKDAMDVMADAGQVLIRAGRLASKDIHQIRKDIDQHLRSINRRIIVFMDDLDRMTPKETSDVFQIIKAVANFPYLNYVLGYDSRLLAKSISQELNLGNNGNYYLEKIVNIQFDLPPNSQQNLNIMLAQLLETTFADNKEFSEVEVEIYRNYLDTGMEALLQNPRVIKRIINHYRVSIAGVENDVYWPDMLALSVIYVTAPEAYRAIANNRGRFLGIKNLYSDSHSESQRQEAAEFHEDWLAKIDSMKHEYIKNVIALLFPNVGFSPIHWNRQDFPSWINKRRVATAECFDSYFQHCIPDGRLPEEEWHSFLTYIDDVDVTRRKLLAFSKTPDTSSGAENSCIPELLDRAKAFIGDKDSPKELAKKILKALLDNEVIIVSIKDKKHEGPFSLFFDNASRLLSLFYQVLKTIHEPDQTGLFVNEVIGWNNGIQTIADFLGSEKTEIERGNFSKYGEIEYITSSYLPLMPVATIQSSLQIICERLKKMAQDGRLEQQYPDLFGITRNWMRIDSDGIAKKWLEEQVKHNLKLFWRIIETISYTTMTTGREQRNYYEHRPDSIAYYFQESVAKDLSKRILSQRPFDLTEEQEKLLREIIDYSSTHV